MTAHWAPSRHVALDGAVNVRDIGGYRSACGLEVLRGRLFRGDSLSQLSDPDLARLDGLGLRTVIDFRTPGEILISGSDRLPYGVEFASLPVAGGDLGAVYELIAGGDHERQRRELGDGRAASLMVEINRGFVADARQREAFGTGLRLVREQGRLPLLYHCSSGKDRAGWLTAIVLTALGVPRELVLRDYLLSNDFHRTGYQKLQMDLIKTGIVADPDLLRPILEQSATYLGAAFEEADRRYGSFGQFLTRGLDVGDAMLGELRRGLLGDLMPREPVPLASAAVMCLPAAPGAEAAQADPGEQREDHAESDRYAHVAQPVGGGVRPQRVGEVARRRVDDVEVGGRRHRAEPPARRGQPGQLREPGLPAQRQHAAGQDDLDHGEQHQERHGLLGRADQGGHEQAQAHRGQAEQGDADQQLDQGGAGQERSAGRERTPGQPEQHQDDRLHDADDAEHSQLGEQIGA
jgi:protein-tyrosine phosphatase